MYWFLYKDFRNENSLFYNWDPSTLRYTLNAQEASVWYEKNKDLMVNVNIKRPPNLEIPTNLPLGTKELTDSEIDTEFLSFINKWALSTRMELILNRFMDNYHLGKDWVFYRRTNNFHKIPFQDKISLWMMKDIIMWVFRVNPFMIPTWKDKKNLNKTEFTPYDIGQSWSIKYHVHWQEFETNVFGVYMPTLFDIMTWGRKLEANGFNLQEWQLDLLLYSGAITYCIAPRWMWKSMVVNGMDSWYLLKDITDVDEIMQEFTVLYMGETQDKNKPYMNYAQQMLNNIVDLSSFCKKRDSNLILTDWDKERSLTYITCNQYDPWRGRRNRKRTVDEAWTQKDWNKVATLAGTMDSVWLLISTINPKAQAWPFYQSWLKAYQKQREYWPIDELIHNIWVSHNMHLCTSPDDYRKKIENWEFKAMRNEFLQARPLVALHYTIEDSQIWSEEQKKAQIEKVMSINGYDYMLAEYYWEYSTEQSVFKLEWAQAPAPYNWDYYVLWYDEAWQEQQSDNPWFCAVVCKDWQYYVDRTENLPKDYQSRWVRLKQLIAEYKSRWWTTYLAIDASRWDTVGMVLNDIGINWDMQIKWTSKITYKPWWKHQVWKAWLIDIAATEFFDQNKIHIDPKCYWEWSLVEEIKHFKRYKDSYRWEKKTHDDQVMSLMLCIYFIWQKEQLWTVSWAPVKTKYELWEEDWIRRTQIPADVKQKTLDDIRERLF